MTGVLIRQNLAPGCMHIFRAHETWLRVIVYVEDALAYKSLCHKTDTLSLRIHRFVGSVRYRIIYGLVVAVFLLLAFVELPSSLSVNSDFTVGNNNTNTRYELPFGVTHSIEFICILSFIADFLARCRISDKPPWKSKWLFAYGVVNLVYVIFFWLFIGLRSSQLRVYRVLRPFYMVQNSSIMKKVLNAVRRSLPEVIGVLVVLTLNVVIFGLSGHILFSDTIKEYFETMEDSLWNFLVLTTTANNPDVMIPAYKVNRLYFIFFIAYIWLGTYGLMNLLLAVIYNQFRHNFKVSVKELIKRRSLALRAAFEVLTNPQIGRNRTTSHQKSLASNQNWEVTADSDDCLIVDDMNGTDEEPTHPTNRCLEVSAVIDIVDDLRMNRKYKNFLYDKLGDHNRMQTDHLDKQDFVKLFFDVETDYAKEALLKRDAYLRRDTWAVPYIKKIVLHPFFEVVGTVFAFVNTVALLAVLAQTPDKDGVRPGADFVFFMNIIVTIYFIIEQVLRFMGVGPKVYIRTYSYCYDLLLTVVVSILMTTFYTRDLDDDGQDLTATNILRSINLCICFRVIRVVMQVKRLRVVVKTYVTLIKHMSSYLGILMALMYMYAIIGMELFSADVTSEIHNKSAVRDNQTLASQCGTYWNLDYYTLNFDDFFASIVTLLTLMVVNNWHIIVNAFSYSRGDWWSTYYFISWWIICVLLILNVIIALILDAFIDRWDKKDDVTEDRGNFHVNQFVDPHERARAFSENELITALHRNNIIQSPFLNINSTTPDLPSASFVNSQQIFCAKSPTTTLRR